MVVPGTGTSTTNIWYNVNTETIFHGEQIGLELDRKMQKCDENVTGIST